MKELHRSLPMMLHRTLDHIMPGFRAIFAAHGLTEPQWRVLRSLWDEDDQAMQSLVQQTLISAPSLVGVIDRLVKAGLVTKHPSHEDRRVVKVNLTDAGIALEAQVTPQVSAAYADIEQRLSASEWENLYANLDLLTKQSKQSRTST